jgi:hypothetical protein
LRRQVFSFALEAITTTVVEEWKMVTMCNAAKSGYDMG